MDLIYSVTRKTTHDHSILSDRLLQAGAIFSLSSRNTVVFTSHTELDDRTGISYQCHVYVADLNLPWKAHKITSHSEEISCLEWDSGGNKILFADIMGTIQIWSMKDYVLNDWTQMTVNYFSGENFLCAAWFHNGKKIGFNSDTKDSLLYMEKFVHTKFSPTLRNFGGPPSEGCVFLSSSGMVCVVIFSSDSTFITGYDGLGPSRHMLKVVDLCHAKNGDFLVVTSDGQVSSPIHCYQVAIKLVNDKCSISSSCLPSFYLNSFTGLGTSEAQCSKVSHVKFVVKEAADAVVVASSGTKGSNVELWVLKEKPINFHKLLTSNNESNVKTVNWQHNATASSLMEIVAVTMPSCSIYEPSPMPSFVIISHKDGTIKCYYRESLQLIYSVNANDGIRNEETNGYGNSKTSICDLHLSHTGSILMAMDSQSQFYLYRLPPVTDPSGSVTANYIVTLLEYCIITGIDWWDVVIGLRSSVIDSVCECLSYSFNQQPQSIQTFWFNKFLEVKFSLYRCLYNGQNKAGDCHALLMLNAISTTFKSLLRPFDLVHHDKDPAENLAATISGKNGETDIDKVLVHVENKEFIVEPQVLLSLQQLIQWVAHFTLFLLSSIPQQHQSMLQFPGCGLIHDSKALTTIQELLVIIRMWGLLKQSCLPVFTKTTGSLDIVSLLFKLVSKTIMCAGSEPDETLIDECCMLTNQVQIHHVALSIDGHGVISPALFKNSSPFFFEYNTEPELLLQQSDPIVPDGVVHCEQKLDVIRHIYLGKTPKNTKVCTRCDAISMTKVTQRAPATRAWDQRWIKSCLCGGNWMMS